MQKIKNFAKKLWQDEAGQGMAEYVLLIVVILAIAAIFKRQIKSAFETKMNDVSSGISGFNGDN